MCTETVMLYLRFKLWIFFCRRALPSIFYVSTVFAIVIICFGVTFQEKFSSTRYGPYGNEHANFRSLFTTILTLFRITTGENWVRQPYKVKSTWETHSIYFFRIF